MRKLVVRLLALLSCANFVVAQEAPMVFRQRLDEGAYKAACGRLDQERLDPAKVAASPFPLWGVRVTAVHPGSQAEQMGLPVGAVIHRINGTERWHHREKLGGAQQIYDVVMPDGTERTFNFGPGRIGTRVGNDHRPENYVYQKIPRGPWDADMVVVAQAWQRGMNDLGEDALRRARDKGLEWNVFFSYYGAQIALDSGDLPKAKFLLEILFAELRGDDQIPRFFHEGVRSLAIVLHEFDLLTKSVVDSESFEGFLQRTKVEEWERWAKKRQNGSLLAEARKHQGKNLMPDIVETGGEIEMIRQNLDSLKQGRLLEAGEPGGYYDRLFKPSAPIRDFIWEGRVAFEQTGPVASSKVNDLSICIVDPEQMKSRGLWDRGDWSVARFSVWQDWNNYRFICLAVDPMGGRMEVPRFLPRMPEKVAHDLKNHFRHGGPLPKIPASAYFRLTLIRMGDEVEILVDDKTFLYLPIQPNKNQLAIEIHNVGMALSLEDVTLREILPQAKE